MAGTFTAKVLTNGTVLSTSTALVYTVPSSTTGHGVIIQVVNPGTNTQQLMVYVQPSGASNDAAADLWIDSANIPADGQIYQFTVGIMDTGDFIRAKQVASAIGTAMNLRIIGVEET